MAVSLDDSNFETTVASGVTLVDFWAEWCGPCRAAAPYVDELSETMNGRSTVAKLNVDEVPAVAQKYGVMSIPTFILFKDGEVVERSTGFSPRFVEDWTARIETALAGS